MFSDLSTWNTRQNHRWPGYLNEPEEIFQLAAGKWRRAALRYGSISRLTDAPLRVPGRVVFVQHPRGDDRRDQSEENQGAEHLQHPPAVAREGPSCHRACGTGKAGGGKRAGSRPRARITPTLTTDTRNRRSYIATITSSNRVRCCHRGDASAGLIHSPVRMPSEAEAAQRVRLMPTRRWSAGSHNVTAGKLRRKELSLCCRFPATKSDRILFVISREFPGWLRHKFEKAYYYSYFYRLCWDSLPSHQVIIIINLFFY